MGGGLLAEAGAWGIPKVVPLPGGGGTPTGICVEPLPGGGGTPPGTCVDPLLGGGGTPAGTCAELLFGGGGIPTGTCVVPLLVTGTDKGFGLESPDIGRPLPISAAALVDTGPLPGGGGTIAGTVLDTDPKPSVGATMLAFAFLAFPRRAPRSLKIFEDNEAFPVGGTPREEVPVKPDPKSPRILDASDFPVDGTIVAAEVPINPVLLRLLDNVLRFVGKDPKLVTAGILDDTVWPTDVFRLFVGKVLIDSSDGMLVDTDDAAVLAWDCCGGGGGGGGGGGAACSLSPAWSESRMNPKYMTYLKELNSIMQTVFKYV